jgi:hypothetical protein
VVVRASAMVMRMRTRVDCNGIGRPCQIRLMKTALLSAPRSWSFD